MGYVNVRGLRLGMTREAKLVIVILSAYFGLLAFYAVPALLQKW
jgi:hypothetical protein